jgi:N utilization substance protein B
MATGSAPGKPRRSAPLSRRDSRRKAFELLFELEQHPGTSAASLLERSFDPELAALYAVDEDAEGYAAGLADAAAEDYIRKLVHAAADNREALDAELAKYPHDWSYDRIGIVERVLLRLTLAEIACVGTADKVAINEAIELAKQYADDEAARFVNGILGSAVANINHLKASLKGSE